MNARYLQLFNELQIEREQEEKKRRDDNVVLVDGMNLFIRTFSAVPTLNDDGLHIGGITGFLISIASIIKQFKPTRLIIVFDGKGGSQKRKQIYSNYKGGRAVRSRLNRAVGFEDIIDEQQSMKWQISRLYEYLSNLPITIICIDNIEADDVIAYLCEYLKNKVTVISNDNDFLQLVSDRVGVYVPAKKTLFTPSLVLDTYGVWCENFILLKSIIGDSSDSISGIGGVGIKTALKYFPQLKENKRIALDEFIDITKNISENSKTAQYIRGGENTIRRNYSLMQLHTPTISMNSQSKIRSIVDGICSGIDNKSLNLLYVQDKLSSIFPRWNEWVYSHFSLLNNLKDKI